MLQKAFVLQRNTLNTMRIRQLQNGALFFFKYDWNCYTLLVLRLTESRA